MNREDLVSLCELFAGRRGIVQARVRIDSDLRVEDPVPEILRSFRRAEISESEKNALLALVTNTDDDDGGDGTVSIQEFAAEQADGGDDD